MAIYEKVFKGAIVDMSTNEIQYFQYNPETFSVNRAMNYAAITIPGLDRPIYQFVSGGEDIIDVKLFLSALGHEKGGQGILDIYFWFKDRTYTKRSDNILQVAPPKVLWVWPKIGSAKCIIDTCNIEWQAFFPDGLPKYGDLTLTLKKSY